MAETDILNPTKGYDRELGDSMNPNVGWQRTRRSTMASVKPAFGRPWDRETGNAGDTYTLNFTRRNRKVTDRLKQFFEQYENGFFTLRDHDMGRDYVGRFVGERPQTFDINGRFSSAGWVFQEIPGCPMVEYPSDWDRWAIIMRPIDDFGDRKAGTFSAVDGAWSRPDAITQDDGTNFVPRQLQNLTPTAGDWIIFEYRGYGFRLWAKQGPSYGIAKLLVDGVEAEDIDLYQDAEMGEQIVYEDAQMPLNIHRVELQLMHTKNAASSGYGIVVDKLEVMR